MEANMILMDNTNRPELFTVLDPVVIAFVVWPIEVEIARFEVTAEVVT